MDAESSIGAKRISNYEIADLAAEHSDIVIPFASIDPHKGKLGAREARDLVENHGVKSFKFHGIMHNAHPADRMAYPIYEVSAEYKLPAIFHTGHSRMGTGMPGGAGLRLKYGQPMLIDDVAADFRDMKVILAHPGWPWADESLSMALHKTNVFIDLSGWSPKYFPPRVIQHAIRSAERTLQSPKKFSSNSTPLGSLTKTCRSPIDATTFSRWSRPWRSSRATISAWPSQRIATWWMAPVVGPEGVGRS